MIIYFLIQMVFLVLSSVVFFLPTVTVLPFGIDYGLSYFMGVVNSLVALMPWMDIVWTFILWGLLLEFLMFSWHWIKWFIERVR